MLISRFDSSNVDLLPLNGYVIGLKDCLNGFGNLSTDAIACNSSKRPGNGKVEIRLNCSPGMSVDVYLPPNLVGLKMSDCTVAIAEGAFSQRSRLGSSGIVLLAIGGVARHIDDDFTP